MKIEIRKLFDSDVVGTRYMGESLKILIEEGLKKDDKVIIDFKDMRLVTHSFLDQSIGTLITKYGKELLNKIKLINMDKPTKDLWKMIYYIRSNH